MRRLRLALAACVVSVGGLGLVACEGTAYQHCEDSKPPDMTVFCRSSGTSLGWFRCGAYRNDNSSVRKYWLVRESDHRVAVAYSC